MASTLPSLIPLPNEDPRGAESWWYGMTKELHSQDDLKNIMINEVTWCKENDIVGHEFLVFKVQITIPHDTAYLKIERSTTREELNRILTGPNPVDAFLGLPETEITESERRVVAGEVDSGLRAKCKAMEIQESKSKSLLSSSSDSLDSLSKTNPSVAHDRISRVDHNLTYRLSSDRIELATYTFGKPGSPPFTLRDLGIMTYVLHDQYQAYDWKERNCYWFSRTLMEIIAMMIPPLGATAISPRAGRAGYNNSKYTSYTPNQTKPREVEELVRKIRQAIENDNERIRKEFETGPAELARQTARGARAEETAAKAVESEARLRREKGESEALLRREKEESEARLRREKGESEALLRREKEESEARLRREKEESEAQFRREKEDWHRHQAELLQRLAQFEHHLPEPGPSSTMNAPTVVTA